MRIETTLSEVLCSYDWEEAFGEGDGGNCTQDVESLDGTSVDKCLRADIAEVLATVEGENDGADWIGVFRMKDGRYLAVVAGCDYTGWDCRASNRMTVASSLKSLMETGLTPEEKARIEA